MNKTEFVGAIINIFPENGPILLSWLGFLA